MLYKNRNFLYLVHILQAVRNGVRYRFPHGIPRRLIEARFAYAERDYVSNFKFTPRRRLGLCKLYALVTDTVFLLV